MSTSFILTHFNYGDDLAPLKMLTVKRATNQARIGGQDGVHQLPTARQDRVQTQTAQKSLRSGSCATRAQ